MYTQSKPTTKNAWEHYNMQRGSGLQIKIRLKNVDTNPKKGGYEANSQNNQEKMIQKLKQENIDLRNQIDFLKKV